MAPVCHVLSLVSWPTLHLIVIKNIAQVWCFMLITPTCSLLLSTNHPYPLLVCPLRSVPRLLLRVLSFSSKVLSSIIAVATSIISSYFRSCCSQCNIQLFVYLFVCLLIYYSVFHWSSRKMGFNHELIGIG